MAYLTRADMDAAYGSDAVTGLLARAGAVGPDSTRMALAVTATEATIDRHLRGRYSVPFEPMPAELLDIARSICWYELWRAAHDVPPDVQARYRDALSALQDLARGLTMLDAPRPESSGSSSFVSAPRKMAYGADWEGSFTL